MSTENPILKLEDLPVIAVHRQVLEPRVTIFYDEKDRPYTFVETGVVDEDGSPIQEIVYLD